METTRGDAAATSVEAAVDLRTQATGEGPKCYLDLEKGGGEALGRLTIQLFADKVPKTAGNFRKLCEGAGVCSSGWTPKPRTYAGTAFHRVVAGFVAQGGDFTRGDGTGGESAYAGTNDADAKGRFADESHRMRHDRRGLLSMANSGPNTNGSQFFLCTAATSNSPSRRDEARLG